MRGGNGNVQFEHIWEPASEMKSHTRMFAKLILEPGCSIGKHEHAAEEEVFYILRGTAQIDDNGTLRTLHAGESCLTGGGAAHSLLNAGTDTLEVLAVIGTY